MKGLEDFLLRLDFGDGNGKRGLQKGYLVWGGYGAGVGRDQSGGY